MLPLVVALILMVVNAAQAAIVADGELHEREELALRAICEALGLEPSKY